MGYPYFHWRNSLLMNDGSGRFIAWAKKASGVATDLTQRDVRSFGLDAGLVDYKICSIDETWSGLKSVYRIKDR